MLRKYEDVVLAWYRKKKVAGELRLRLSDPAPAKLRDECIAVLYERYSARDNKILSEFFELGPDEKLTEQVIKRFDIDKFRPLNNYLKGDSSSTDLINVELLAWLIDFHPRPQVFGTNYGEVEPPPAQTKVNAGSGSVDQTEEIFTGERDAADDNTINTSFLQVNSGKPYFKYLRIVVLAVLGIIIITGALLYDFGRNRYPKVNLTGLERCMYWAGDHYEQVSCSQQFRDTLVIAFDSVRFHKLKRILRPDTISFNSIGNIWYIRKNKKIEYYTSDGYYPADPKLRLRPLTAYIIRKYILEVQNTD